MNKPVLSSIPLNYAKAISRTPPKFRIGTFALFMTSLPVLIDAMVVLEVPSSLSSGCSGVYDGYLHYGETAMFVGASLAVLGLFQYGGRIPAVVALAIYFVESIFHPALIVCH